MFEVIDMLQLVHVTGGAGAPAAAPPGGQPQGGADGSGLAQVDGLLALLQSPDVQQFIQVLRGMLANMQPQQQPQPQPTAAAAAPQGQAQCPPAA